MRIDRDRVVRMHYTLRDERGATLESSHGSDPLSYLHGSGQIIPGLERALQGEAAGTRREITVAPHDAYGELDPSARVRIPLADFPSGLELAPGVEVQAETPDGPLDFLVVSVDGDTALLDANHPLAGKTLTFDVEIVDVRPATPDEIAHRHVHGPDGAHGHA
jgi:FKBP-type peptidyl-prolyl cis-trans isomerase SlyD